VTIVPDHSTISRTRRLIDVATHRAVFTWVQQRLVAAGLLNGKTVAIDGTTLEANAATRSATCHPFERFRGTGSVQFSRISPFTRLNSAMLFVISLSPRLRA
jgi:hypothetical protein